MFRNASWHKRNKMPYNIDILGLTFDFVGKVLIAVTALLVHRRVKKEGKIDKSVLKEMSLEQGFGVLGIIFLIIGYLLHVSLRI